MQTKIAANAQAMKRWLGKAETTLGNHSDRLNAINIFPVADGDTGTNLYLTVRAAAHACDAGRPLPCRTRGTGSLRGPPERRRRRPRPAGRAAMEQARGNSGTLFAVFLCAAAEPLAGHARLSAPLLAAALNRAQIRAWSALSDPVPGTMLSVMEAAARAAAAVDAAHDGDDSNHALGLALDAAVEAALEAVVRTEDQLAALHAAHVVDAGGVGMLLILDCLRSAVLGEELQSELLDGLHGYDVQDPHIHAGMPDDDGVEVMCTIELSPLDAATLRQRLDELGDSVIMSQVGGAAEQPGATAGGSTSTSSTPNRPWPLIRSLGEPVRRVRQRAAVPRDPATRAFRQPASMPRTRPSGPRTDMNAELDLGLERRIGKRSAAVIEKHLGITTVGGLLNYFPRRYLSRGELTPISEVPLDEEVTLIARVLSSSTRPMRARRGSLTDVVISDDADEALRPGCRQMPGTLKISFFNGFRAKAELQPGRRAMFSGKVTRYGGPWA